MLSELDRQRLTRRLLNVDRAVSVESTLDRTILGDSLSVMPHLPSGAFDLIVADPPYNLTKTYAGTKFSRMAEDEYEAWIRCWMPLARDRLSQNGSIYICCDWQTSGLVQRVAREYFNVRNRITWEREKGRGAARNWKNCSEDIWFCTMSDSYTFDVAAVKQKRKVLAPYRHGDGTPKDWESSTGGCFRETHPSNLWTDLTVPFWSMPENTDHPTQKPEKLLAKLILASCPLGGLVLDPFLGSGTTSAAAFKLGRRFVGIEIEPEYCLLAERRLELAASNPAIQGYVDGVFWERNTVPPRPDARDGAALTSLFENLR